jgi:hypothetical protein
MKRHEKKGRCKIGKYWCPLVKRNYNKNKQSLNKASGNSSQTDNNTSISTPPEICDDLLSGFESQIDEGGPPLFSDVFLGASTNLMDHNHKPQLFSF